MRRLLQLLDDTPGNFPFQINTPPSLEDPSLTSPPVVPGDVRPAFEHSAQARQILNDAEEDLREWQPSIDPVPSSATDMGINLMPSSITGGSTVDPSVAGEVQAQLESPEKDRDVSGSTIVQQEVPMEYQRQ